MAMWIYRLKDFLQSRNGQITLFGLATAGLFAFLASHMRQRRAAKDEVASRLPSITENTSWNDPEASPSEPAEGEAQEFTFSAPNQSFRPFRPIAPKPQPAPAPVKSEPPPAATPKTPSLVGAGFPLPPMIVSEREAKAPHETGPIMLPKPEPKAPSLEVEEGTLLYCELIAPVSSDQIEAPVLARLTRPLKRGKTLLPAGTSLSGSLQRTHENRMFFASDWRVKLPSGAWVPIKAHAQEAAYNEESKTYAASDGRAGIPTLIAPMPKKKSTLWRDTLGKVAVAAGELGQDRTRTAIGEFVPGTARNTVLRATSGVIEHSTNRPKDRKSEPDAIPSVEAGHRFYLYLSGYE